MRAPEFITEGFSSKLFHYTDLAHATSILKDGEFKLSSVIGSSYESEINPKEYPYFLSTSRTKHGNYSKDPYAQGVMFNLDGNYYKHNLKGLPVDYWGDKHKQHEYGRRHEAEDRIVSKNSTIPLDGVTEIHIYLRPRSADDINKNDSKLPTYARTLIILAKQRGIPTYVYDDPSAWAYQRKDKVVPVTSNTALKGHTKPGRTYNSRDQLKPWWDLITHSSTKQLDDYAKKELRNLLYYYRTSSSMGMDIDMSNSRKPGSSGYNTTVNIIKFMRNNKFVTIPELINFLYNKWSNIYNTEKQTPNFQIL